LRRQGYDPTTVPLQNEVNLTSVLAEPLLRRTCCFFPSKERYHDQYSLHLPMKNGQAEFVCVTWLNTNHRLNGSSSPVLTATPHSYVLLYLFSRTDLEATPQPIFTQNGLNDVDPRIDVPFAVKIKTFSNP